MITNDESQALEEVIIKLLLTRDPGKSICPSEVVRILFPLDWRTKMSHVRLVAGKLMEENVLVITQKNQTVEISAKGPIRLKLKA